MMKISIILLICFLLTGLMTVTNATDPSIFTCTVSIPTDPEYEVSDNNFSSNTAAEKNIKDLLEKTNANTKSINEIKDHIKNTSFTTEGTLNNILLFVEELMKINNVTSSSASPLPKSCEEIQQRMPASPSGVYLIAPNEKKTQYVYCYMDMLCNSDGGWTRLAHIDMRDSSQNCPGGLRQYSLNSVRACGRPVSGSGSCHSVKYPSHGVHYSQICGRAKGYSYYSPDALDSTIGPQSSHNDINSYYVDGLSITRGSPRKHIWTFAACGSETSNVLYRCPCQLGSLQTNKLPSFINKDYFCEATAPTNSLDLLRTNDPLWDGHCGESELDCCKNKSFIPWFNKQLSTTTSDYIELRVCADQGTVDEDVAVEQLEIYVK